MFDKVNLVCYYVKKESEKIMVLSDTKMNNFCYPMYFAWDYLPCVHFGVSKKS